MTQTSDVQSKVLCCLWEKDKWIWHSMFYKLTHSFHPWNVAVVNFKFNKKTNNSLKLSTQKETSVLLKIWKLKVSGVYWRNHLLYLIWGGCNWTLFTPRQGNYSRISKTKNSVLLCKINFDLELGKILKYFLLNNNHHHYLFASQRLLCDWVILNSYEIC